MIRWWCVWYAYEFWCWNRHYIFLSSYVLSIKFDRRMVALRGWVPCQNFDPLKQPRVLLGWISTQVHTPMFLTSNDVEVTKNYFPKGLVDPFNIYEMDGCCGLLLLRLGPLSQTIRDDGYKGVVFRTTRNSKWGEIYLDP